VQAYGSYHWYTDYMIEARTFVGSLDLAKQILESEHAELKGFYEIDDAIYRSSDEKVTLNDEFLRLRVMPVNIWPTKDVVLVIKCTNLHKVGKHSDIPEKIQFDRREEAEKYFKENFVGKYIFDFSFFRIGWQYFLPNGDVVDLEIIEEKYPTIEFKSDTDEGISNLLTKFDIQNNQIIKGPSVVAVKQLLST
jgi:hypothetical protein